MKRTPPRHVRHGRQSRLAEVGAAGQHAIDAASVRVAQRGFAGVVEARYLAGAGVRELVVAEDAHERAAREVDGAVRVARAPMEEDGDAAPIDGLDQLDTACAEIARGAASALASLRAILDAAEKRAAAGEGG